MIACVAFDFDGVLVDSNAVKRQAYFDIFESYGASGAEAVAAALATDVDGDRFILIRHVLGRLGAEHLDAAVAQLAERYNDICETYAATCPEVPGASATLEALAGRYPLYVISATPEAPLCRIVARRGWSGRFRAVLGRPTSKVEHLRWVFAREGVSPAAAVFVGDGRRDLQAAREVGCRFIGVRNQFNDFAHDGLRMIDDLHGLPALLRAEAGAC